MEERTRRPLTTTATELQFADNAALVGSSIEQIERPALILDGMGTVEVQSEERHEAVWFR